MARIKRMIKGAQTKGLKSKRYEDRGPRRGEQGKPRDPGYSGGKRTKAIGCAQQRRAYEKRVQASR